MYDNRLTEKAEVIKRLRPFFDIVSAEYLSGGLSNRCMKLTDKCGEHYVWRPQNDAAHVFGLQREHEYCALLIASEGELTSKPVALIPDGLITQWIEGQTLNHVDLNIVIGLLVQIHELPALSNVFDPFEKAEHYFSHLKTASKTDAVERVHHYFQQNAFKSGLPLTTCHYDLGYYNLIQQCDGKLSVIDWEYSALGDPALDIVMTSMANDIDLFRAVNQYCLLRDIKDIKQWQDACQKWVPVAQYLGLLWYLLGKELYGLDIYRERAQTFLALLEHSISTLTNVE